MEKPNIKSALLKRSIADTDTKSNIFYKYCQASQS